MCEDGTPRGFVESVCSSVVCAGVEGAVDVVGGEVHTWEELVKSFGDRWEVMCAPGDGSLYFAVVSAF